MKLVTMVPRYKSRITEVKADDMYTALRLEIGRDIRTIQLKEGFILVYDKANQPKNSKLIFGRVAMVKLSGDDFRELTVDEIARAQEILEKMAVKDEK